MYLSFVAAKGAHNNLKPKYTKKESISAVFNFMTC